MLLAFVASLAMPGVAWPQPAPPSEWRRPPRAILDVLHAPGPPMARLSHDGSTLALMTLLRYPPLADLAQPMLKLAGVRVLAGSNGRHAETHMIDLTLVSIADGTQRKVAVPPDARIFNFQWSADGRRFAFLNQTPTAVELWVGEREKASVQRIEGVRINPMLYSELSWMPDQQHLLVKSIAPDRGDPPARPAAPIGPKVQEASRGTATSTYEARDLLTSPHDAALFEYYGKSQLALVDAGTGSVSLIGKPDLYTSVDPSPDGTYLLVETIRKPFSYAQAWYRFAHDVEVWDMAANVVHTVARLPLADRVPIHGVPEGPRDIGWRDTAPATLVWAEAQDGGDPGRKAAHRDLVRTHKAPFREPARDLHRVPHRFSGIVWGADGLAIVTEWERERRWVYATAINADAPSVAPRRLYDLSANDAYNDPGEFVMARLPSGRSVLEQDGDAIFLQGDGSSPEGDRPFLDRFSLTTLAKERLWRCDTTGWERFAAWIDPAAHSFLTRRESPTDFPNYVVRTLTAHRQPAAPPGEAEWESSIRKVTDWTDPTPQIRSIQKRIVTYTRADSTPLSFTLYLPPDYKEGARLPTVVDAYPLDYSDPATAGQVVGSDRQFTRLTGFSSLFFLLDGYAVLQDVAMPVVGDPDNAYDQFVEQVVASSDAAIKKAVELGVTDPARVGVLGHSHGGLMTATLLAHSDAYRAGIARSGAYNHTMRPFGFQGERRTYWQAPETYVRLSPTLQANKINEPILIIHGEMDENPGTVPLQSEKLYDAIRGTGGTARLLMLPFEGHGYRSRESVEDVLAEQLEWFGKYVRNAPPRGSQ